MKEIILISVPLRGLCFFSNNEYVIMDLFENHFRPLAGFMFLFQLHIRNGYAGISDISVPLRGLCFFSLILSQMAITI